MQTKSQTQSPPTSNSTPVGTPPTSQSPGSGSNSPHPTMRFQKNLMLQKHQAEMEDQRETWERKYKPVYEAVTKEYECAKQWHDPFSKSLRRLNAPTHIAQPPNLSDTQAFHHNRLRNSSSFLQASLGANSGSPGSGSVSMIRTRSSGPTAPGGTTPTTHSSASLSRPPKSDAGSSGKSNKPPVAARAATTVRGLSALLRGDLLGGAAKSH
ncbi:hypothetical protein DFJ77DRAFT_457556 [Powellomyces hirtus]|nr:hypothetical protein DFJ77DRAFT_457556 [Powellomyces hirtus]